MIDKTIQIDQTKIDEIYTNGLGVLNNRYILLEKIEDGGMSAIFKVQDIYCEYFEDKKDLVVKIPSHELMSKKDISAFIYAEYKYLRDLINKNIVKAYDFGIDQETQIPYIIMEYLDGEPLENLPLYNMSNRYKNYLLYTLLDTLEYIHAKGIIHSDIAPKNIMVLKDTTVKLFDFGISQQNNQEQNIGLNYAQCKAYNPKYCAPEILEGEKPSQKSDFFSLALVLYEIFSLELPFKENSLELKNEPITFEKCSKKIPFFLREWFSDMLDINPNKRRKKIPIIYKIFSTKHLKI